MKHHCPLLPTLILPVLLIGVMGHFQPRVPRPEPSPASDGGPPPAADGFSPGEPDPDGGFAAPETAWQRRRLLPFYTKEARQEYRRASAMRARRRVGGDAGQDDRAYAQAAETYNGIARVYPEAVGPGLPPRLPPTAAPHG